MEFEKKLEEIEKIAQQLESGELSLDKAIELYAKAMENCNECSKFLSEAKGKIQILNQAKQVDTDALKDENV